MPGRRFTVSFEINGSPYVMDHMFVLKDNRVFHLMAMGGEHPLSSEDIDRFFGSFQVTGPPREWKRSRSDPNAVVAKDDPEFTQVVKGVTSFECPTYPAVAKESRIEGMVLIEVRTDGKKVTSMKTTGIPELSSAAEQNLRTWKFAAEAPTKFTVTYLYVGSGEYAPDPIYKCGAKLELPNRVEVGTSW
jgi:hypothetical protein